MQSDDDILRTILSCVEVGTIRADQVMGFVFEGLDNSLKEADSLIAAARRIARLRELQALAERVIRISLPENHKRPRLVSAK